MEDLYLQAFRLQLQFPIVYAVNSSLSIYRDFDFSPLDFLLFPSLWKH